MKEVLWIDTDCGFDDICAISLLDHFGSFSLSGKKISYISTVNGMTNPRLGARVLSEIFSSNGFHNKPTIACGSDTILSQKHSLLKDTSWGINYQNFCHKFTEKYLNIESDKLLHSDGSGEKFVIHTIDELVNQIKAPTTKKITLLCLGPLTNIANIIRRYPTFLVDNVERIVLMGGAVQVVGNAPHGSEYNFYFDPEAVSYVFKNCNVPITMLGLEVANEQALTLVEHGLLKSQLVENINKPVDNSVRPLDGISRSVTALGLVRDIINNEKDHAGYDVVVSYYLINPQAFTTSPVNITIDNQTGKTSLISTDSGGKSISDDSDLINSHVSIELQLATDFSRKEYFDYLLSNIFKE
jgi:inosine-uridine nucleoside N-ribohydrolase